VNKFKLNKEVGEGFFVRYTIYMKPEYIHLHPEDENSSEVAVEKQKPTNILFKKVSASISFGFVLLAAGIVLSGVSVTYWETVNAEYIPVSGEVRGTQVLVRKSHSLISGDNLLYFQIRSSSRHWYGMREVQVLGVSGEKLENLEGHASSFFGDHVPALAVDGNTNTAWVANTLEDSFTFFVGKTHTVSKVRILPAVYTESPEQSSTIIHELWGSTDGVNYIQLGLFPNTNIPDSWLEWSK
jgi:hypothetical protein